MFWLPGFCCRIPVYPGSSLASSEQSLRPTREAVFQALGLSFVCQIARSSQLSGCASSAIDSFRPGAWSPPSGNKPSLAARRRSSGVFLHKSSCPTLVQTPPFPPACFPVSLAVPSSICFLTKPERAPETQNLIRPPSWFSGPSPNLLVNLIGSSRGCSSRISHHLQTPEATAQPRAPRVPSCLASWAEHKFLLVSSSPSPPFLPEQLPRCHQEPLSSFQVSIRSSSRGAFPTGTSQGAPELPAI